MKSLAPVLFAVIASAGCAGLVGANFSGLVLCEGDCAAADSSGGDASDEVDSGPEDVNDEPNAPPGTVLAYGVGTPTSIASDGVNVYFTTDAPNNGQVMACAISGCGFNPTVLASGLQHPANIALGESTVYWWDCGSFDCASTPNRVASCTKTGCSGTPTTFATVANGGPNGIAVDAARVYWTANHQVMSCPIAGCNGSPTLVATANNSPGMIVSGGTAVYWEGGGQILKCAVGGCGTPTLLVDNQNTYYLLSLAVEGENVYWPNEPGISACSVNGCADQPTVVVPHSAAAAMTVDGTSIYWADTYINPSLIWKCPIAGCQEATWHALASTPSGENSPIAMAVDGVNVYWAVNDDINGGITGKILEAPK